MAAKTVFLKDGQDFLIEIRRGVGHREEQKQQQSTV